ncbi:MAG: hypothetical protein HQL03_15835, partial [Nitrospirae bacterium]|nr:hypothetical protein [Nitrospirota bacterium]
MGSRWLHPLREPGASWSVKEPGTSWSAKKGNAAPFLTVSVMMALCIVLFVADSACGIEYDLTSRSYLYLSEDAREQHYSPFYEHIDFNVRGLMEGKLSLYSSGWLGYNLRQSYEERTKDELTY